MAAKRNGRIAGVVLLLAGMVHANAGPFTGPAQADEQPSKLQEYAQGDPIMSAAQAKARAHIDDFFDTVLDSEGASRPDASIKVAIPTADGRAEVIWVSPFGRLPDGTFLGTFANQPRHIEGKSIGDTVSFDRAQVRDWSFLSPKGRMYGHFTTRVIAARLDAENAAQIASALTVSPLPAGW